MTDNHGEGVLLRYEWKNGQVVHFRLLELLPHEPYNLCHIFIESMTRFTGAPPTVGEPTLLPPRPTIAA